MEVHENAKLFYHHDKVKLRIEQYKMIILVWSHK